MAFKIPLSWFKEVSRSTSDESCARVPELFIWDIRGEKLILLDSCDTTTTMAMAQTLAEKWINYPLGRAWKWYHGWILHFLLLLLLRDTICLVHLFPHFFEKTHFLISVSTCYRLFFQIQKEIRAPRCNRNLPHHFFDSLKTKMICYAHLLKIGVTLTISISYARVNSTTRNMHRFLHHEWVS